MKRNFIFIVPDLSYQKNDLNVKESNTRVIIGQLARMITNTLFLSHSLRKDILILILVLKPKLHLYKISSESIRYLGPELRSSASLFLKAERFFQEKLLADEKQLEEKWLEPNPGLFVKLTNLPFADLNENLDFLLFENHQSNDSQIMTLQDLEEFTLRNILMIPTTYFVFSMIKEHSFNETIQLLFSKTNLKKIKLVKEIPLPNILTIINLILDKIEELEIKVCE